MKIEKRRGIYLKLIESSKKKKSYHLFTSTKNIWFYLL